MTSDTSRLIELRLRQARRRLGAGLVLRSAGVALGVSLALCLAWLLAEPFLTPDLSKNNRLSILVGVVVVALMIALWRSWRVMPAKLDVAMAIDRQFELQERLTAACSLPAELNDTPAARALVSDVRECLEKVRIREKFPVRPGWRALFLPAQVAGILLVWFLYDPVRIGNWARGTPTEDPTIAQIEDPALADKAVPGLRAQIKPPSERADSFKDNKELQDLKAELEKLYAENNKDRAAEKTEQVREKVAEVAKAEDVLKKHAQQMAEKFQKLQKQLEGMTQLDKDEARPDGPGKELEDALSKGDLKKAQEEADRLKKKARDKNLDPKDAEQLKKEIEQMEERADKLQREQKQQEKKLQDLIKQAKKENRDAESLERELKDLMQAMAAGKESEKLAEAMKQARKALEQQDFEGLAEQMEQLSKQLGDLQEQLQDLEDVEEHLQNLKELKKSLCKECEGADKSKAGEKDYAKGYGDAGAGKRDENKDALTKKGDDTQVRGFFDPRGKKRYGGTTNGPAFKQKSTAEMAGEIQQAVQEAPEAVEVQRLPRGAKEMIREYFEKLGGEAPKK